MKARPTPEGGVALIKSFEKLRLKRYQDPAGLPTIGWGHLIVASDEVDGKLERITADRADELLRADLGRDERKVCARVHNPDELADEQYGALVSLVFNVGRMGDQLRRTINLGRFEEVPDVLRRYCKLRDPETGALVVSKGLLRRREAEIALWNSAKETEP